MDKKKKTAKQKSSDTPKALRKWVKPKFEKVDLKKAMAGPGGTSPDNVWGQSTS